MNEERVIIEEQMSYHKDLPQLIVALDKDDNYIHIRDTKDDVDYFCPCCRNSVKPRANKKDKDYQVQAHFYHVNGSCDEESRVHWLYKNWLFKSGSKFYIENTLYEVDTIEIEKTHKTSFGNYRPDMTIHTKCGKTILFEVNFSSSKTENTYMEKWCELNYDVVEVNIRKLMNEDYDNKIPRFTLVYSDGECYKKSYASRDDYSEIAKIKNEWKRQDKINYKIMWERLDWFWLTLQNYKHEKESFENVLESFKCIDIKDKEICFDIIKKQSCIKGKVAEFRDIINDEIRRFSIPKDMFYGVEIISSEFRAIEKKFLNIKITSKYKETKFEISESEHSKEWVFKFSNILKIKEKIQIKINNKIKELDELEMIESDFRPYLINFIYKNFNNKIWEASIENNLYRGIYVEINIKNPQNGYHKKSIYFNSNEEEKVETLDAIKNNNLENFIKEKFRVSMRKIYNYVSKHDGIGCEYRHMWTEREDL